MLPPLRERVAEALYNEPVKTASTRTPWKHLDASRKKPWLADADRVIPIVLQAVSRLLEQRDPEKPGNWLIRRERLPDVIAAILHAAPEPWVCPLERPGCRENCGAYSCHN